MNRRFLARLVLGLLALLSATDGRAQQPPTGEAEVTGSVRDSQGGGTPGGRVLFTSGDRKIVAETTNTGNYTVELPPGIYTVSVVRDGFCPSRRGAFSLKPGAHAQFDFELTVCPIIDYFIAPERPAGATYRELLKVRQPGRYGEEELKPISPAGLRPLVMYGDRQEDAESIIYTPLAPYDAPNRHLPVVYTYDLLTIRSDRLIYFPKDNSIEASGHVVWQDGSQTRLGSKLTLSFRAGQPVVAITD